MEAIKACFEAILTVGAIAVAVVAIFVIIIASGVVMWVALEKTFQWAAAVW